MSLIFRDCHYFKRVLINHFINLNLIKSKVIKFISPLSYINHISPLNVKPNLELTKYNRIKYIMGGIVESASDGRSWRFRSLVNFAAGGLHKMRVYLPLPFSVNAYVCEKFCLVCMCRLGWRIYTPCWSLPTTSALVQRKWLNIEPRWVKLCLHSWRLSPFKSKCFLFSSIFRLKKLQSISYFLLIGWSKRLKRFKLNKDSV